MSYWIHRKAGKVSICLDDHPPWIVTEKQALEFAEKLVNVLSDEKDDGMSIMSHPDPLREALADDN